jgi:nuclear pore complex protein Nup98-Nup96
LCSVFFRYKEIEIYPNDDVKPPVGTGLNRRAQVTLDRVWPIDKTTREIIKDPERLKQLKFEAKLKRASAKMNARFIEYRPLPAGSWVFEVSPMTPVENFLSFSFPVIFYMEY